MLAGTTGLRRSEMFALRWSDVNFQGMQVALTRSCVRNRFGGEDGRKRETCTSAHVPLRFADGLATQDVLQRGRRFPLSS
jgi:integrase